ncbi:hypothetical protein CVT25_003115 [Psilocybe cyanescens]|uniref:Class II aldolase/adducin N-terminal domain-containing protein n=1 Tax=Psilocybe cyanescens TaxID=93625 RepID=A0A409XQI8_PSICY|nr:hypothetical protein CVT25_003115 [Psilocybe cyanescens]
MRLFQSKSKFNLRSVVPVAMVWASWCQCVLSVNGQSSASAPAPSASASASASPSVTSAAIDLLNANHILHFLDVVDAFGHISVRNPDNASQFIMSFAIAPALATSQSLVTYDIDNATALHLTFNSSVTGSAIPSSFLERFIHSQIFKAFPDVTSVVHAHTSEVLPFGAAGVGLRAQMGTAGSVGALSSGTPIFDTNTLPASILPPSAPHDLLIRDTALGDALAREFVSASAIVLMKGHGMAVKGAGIRDAVFRAFYTKQSAVVQLQAMALSGGKMTGLDAREAADAATTNEGQSLLNRAWDLWVAQVSDNPLYINDLIHCRAPTSVGFFRLQVFLLFSCCYLFSDLGTGNSRRPELTQTNLVDIFLFRADSQQQLLHFPQHPNPPDRAGMVTAQVNDTWFGANGLNFQGTNVSFPYFWVIIRSDATLANGNFIPQPIFTAVQTQVLDSVASPSTVPSTTVSPSSLSTSPNSSPRISSPSSPSSPPSSSSTSTAGNVQHASSASSFPRWAIAVIVVLGFFAIAATCILAFVILRRIRRRQQRSSTSSRNSMGSASPMMPRDQQHHPEMIQRYDSAGSPLLAPVALGAAAGAGAGSSHQHTGGPGSTTHDGASAISDTGGPFSGADAAIMADAFRKMLRKPDFADRPVEEGESPEQPEGAGAADAAGARGSTDAGHEVLRGQLAEEGRDIRSVSSSRGVKVESQELDPSDTR